MKIDRENIKRSRTEVPPDCKILIDKLKGCQLVPEILDVLKTVNNKWTYGRSELYHWIDVLDLFDSVLSKASEKSQDGWTMQCDVTVELYKCVIHILQFTRLLMEHSFSRNTYNSMEHLANLLASSNLHLVTEVLLLLYLFSKRSNFLKRLPEDQRQVLLDHLTYMAESWGGKEAGFGLAACCQDLQLSAYPSTATSVHLEFIKTMPSNESGPKSKITDAMTVVHMDEIHKQKKNIQAILSELCTANDIPPEKQVALLTDIRLAYYFPLWSARLLCVQARLLSLAILVYANASQDNRKQLLYRGLMEELVDVLQLEGTFLTDIKAAALGILTSIIHSGRAQNSPNIIEATGAASYHGFLPKMVRSCIAALISTNPTAREQYPSSLVNALFGFLYYLGGYDQGGEALVNCGMLEGLLKMVNWNTTNAEQISFVTRAIRVIDLITNMEMQAFQTHNGLATFITCLETEVNVCRKDQPFEIIPEISTGSRDTSDSGGQERSGLQSEGAEESNGDAPMDTDSSSISPNAAGTSSATMTSVDPHAGSAMNFTANGLTCLPQRAALLKSLLDFLKKVIQDPAFSDNIRHIMETSLPSSLKHIISNAEYYGASLFSLATDVVTVYVFQEPSLLSPLQDSGLTDIVAEAHLVKNIPPTREAITSMPNVFSALCLNTRGLNAFVRCNPFQRLFRILISPEYLPVIRRRRTAEPMGETATDFGIAMDELMRHQPSLKVEAIKAIVQLLEELCVMGRDLKYSGLKSHSKPVVATTNSNPRNGNSDGGSSEEEEDDDQASTDSPPPVQHEVNLGDGHSNQSNPQSTLNTSREEKTPVPLVDYIFNVMKFLDSVLSNNSSDDHCKEFVAQSGLVPLMTILSLPNLPIDFPTSPACQALSSVCKSILNLAHEPKVLAEGLTNLEEVLTKLEILNEPIEDPGSSVLLRELTNSGAPSDAGSIFHMMTATHAYVMMFIHVCRTSQSDSRTMSIANWGTSQGLGVLKTLSQLYLNLISESTFLLALCSGECQPGRQYLDNLILPDKVLESEVNLTTQLEPPSSSITNHPSDLQLSLPTDIPIESSEQNSVSVNSISMEVETEGSTNPLIIHTSTQTSETSSNLQLENCVKLIKPILSISSPLGRTLVELFGILVKLSVGTPLRQRRGQHLPTLSILPLAPGAAPVANVLAELLTSGLQWKPKPKSPVPRLTFSICAVGFSGPLLFDEKKSSYHLMLKKFMDVGGIAALFEVFYWAMSKDANLSCEEGKDTLSEHQIEFLDSWLLLVEKFVSPKSVTESPHTLPTKISIGQRLIVLDTQLFLGHVHKMSFEAIMYLWKRTPMKNYGTRAVESMFAILCHILRHKDERKPGPKPTEVVPLTRPLSRTYMIQRFRARAENQGDVRPTGPEIPELDAIDRAYLSMNSQMANPMPIDALPCITPNLSSLLEPGTPEGAAGSTAPGSLSSGLDLEIANRPSTSANVTLGNMRLPALPEIVPLPTSEVAEGEERGEISNENNDPNQSHVIPSEDVDPELRALIEQSIDELEADELIGIEPIQSSVAPVLDLQNLPESLGEPGPERETPPIASGSGEQAATATISEEVVEAARRRGVQPLNVQQLLDMGFLLERCVDALASTGNLLQATDFLLNGLGGEYPQRAENVVFRPIGDRRIGPSNASRASMEERRPGMFMEWDGNMEDEMLRAIEMSLDEPTVRLRNITSGESHTPLEDHNMAKELLKPEDVDFFTKTVLGQCLSIIDELPGSVFRVCELLVAVGQRNGIASIRNTLCGIAHDIKTIISQMWKLDLGNTQLNYLCNTHDGSDGLKLATRVHLFSLIFEELKDECAELFESFGIIFEAEPLIQTYAKLATAEPKMPTPKWLAPLILLIDLYEKTAIASRRRKSLFEETDNVWKWFDINSGKWCNYSTINNLMINDAFWNGENSVRITAGRRPYVINFNGMVQLNEETNNRRPITIWLKELKPDTPMPTVVDQDMDDDSDAENCPVANVSPRPAEPENPKKVAHCKTFLGLTKECVSSLVMHLVKLMSIPVKSETLHAVMRLCLRLTRHHEIAVIFAQHGGVHQLLTLNQESGFAGFLPLANLLIRHVLEDPGCLKYTIEKMIRAKTTGTGASACKEVHYLLRVLAPVACRNPELFVSVAKDILRVDIGFVTRRAEEDLRLIVKPLPCKSESLKTSMGECARGVIQQLLVALTLHRSSDDDALCNSDKKTSEAAPKQASKNTQTHLLGIDEQMDTNKPQKEDTKNETNELQSQKLLIPKYAICQLLAESVQSYSYSCKIIAEYLLQAGTSPSVPEDCTALAFLLDKMLPPNQNVSEKDCSPIVRELVSAMAGCNHLPDAQAIVICEVKAALQRALAMKESADKHTRIQSLAGLICTIIESCPSTPPTQMVSGVKPQQLCMNQAIRLLIRKNVVVDLARVPHNLDLSSTHMAATVNAALKPLELISRVVNQPVNIALNVAIRTGGPPTGPYSNAALRGESDTNTQTGGTGNSDETDGQGPNPVEDNDNTQQDTMEAATENLESNFHESHGGSHEHDLEQIMDQLLDIENNEEADILGDGETAGNRMDTEEEQNERRDFEDTHDRNDSTDSESDHSDGDDDDDEEDENSNEDEDEDDDEEEEEEEEEDDDEAESNAEDIEVDPEMIQEGFIRLPNEDDLVMVHYGSDPENAPLFYTNYPNNNRNMGLFDESSISENSSGLRWTHPLLTAPITDPPVATVATRGHRPTRHRRLVRNIYPPAILQRLLGVTTALQLTNGQALNQGIRDSGIVLLDPPSDQARNDPGGNSNCLANYTALHWWGEEAKVLDGVSMYDCVIAIKRDIVETLEQDRDKEFQKRREKRLQELKEEASKKTASIKKPIETNSIPPNIEPDVPNQNVTVTEINSSEAPNITEPTAESLPSTEMAAASNSSESNLVAVPATGTPVDQEEKQEDFNEDVHMEEAAIEEPTEGTVSASRRVEEEERPPIYLFEDIVARILHQDPEPIVEEPPEAPEEPSTSTDAIPIPPSGEPSSANAEASDPVPGPSGTQPPHDVNEDFRCILGDIEIPEGVDPSFLAALPEDMRQEVISEHLRTQRLRQGPQTTVPQETLPANLEVSPEFLAALPRNIQEEVLAQQRIEQLRRLATTSSPSDPVDPEAFFRDLQPSLRQTIMADMEESQLALLPADLATEAQSIRRERETRARQILHDRLFIHNHRSELSSILRNSAMRGMGPRFGLHAARRTPWQRPGPASQTATSLLPNSKVRGKQLVDHETLSCLLVLLFVDEPRLNTGRLHRVLRNLCYHAPTRQWVIRSLLSVMERANDCTLTNYQSQAAIEYPGGDYRELETFRPPPDKKSIPQIQTPSWLNINLDAALGCRASVFQIQRTGSSTSKKGGADNRHISMHSQAAQPICRHTLDVLSNVAKTFRVFFLPNKTETALLCLESGSKILGNEKEGIPADATNKARNASVSSTGKGNKATESSVEFWDLLLKLDSATSSKKGKSLAKVHSTSNLNSDQSASIVSFDNSPFGQLISMLAYPFVRHSSIMTDKLLRLLSLISSGIPDTSGYGKKVLLEEPETPEDASSLISESQLRLIVTTITNKSCSEEGLEDAMSLLLNLSYGPPSTRDRILSLLMEGVRELGNVVCGHIAGLMNELKTINKNDQQDFREGAEEQEGSDKKFKGSLMDRFTKENVVITSGGKGKAHCELHLPSMAVLTSKTSSQAFFLRLLKVIINLRDSIRAAIKKHKGKTGGPNFSSTMVAAVEDALNRIQNRTAAVREVYESLAALPGNNSERDDEPMDVDGEESQVTSSNPADGAENASGTGNSTAGTQEQSKLSSSDADNVKDNGKKFTLDESKLLPRLSSALDLDSLWETLSKCLLELGHTPDLHAVLVLQPAVEAFFLVHASHLEREDKKTTGVRESREQQLAHLQQDLPPVSPIIPVERPSSHQVDSEMFESSGNLSALDSTLLNATPLKPDTQKFLNFAETHRTVLNQILRQSTSPLADGPFAVLVDHTRVLDFDVKRKYFRSELQRLDEGVRREDLAIHVRRSNVFEDSFREFHRRTVEEWKSRFYIAFEGEEGQDAGGLLREWYMIISREIFNPMYALFTISPGDRVTYMINPLSHCNSNHLFYFKFVGRVIAKAIYDNKLLECYFTRSFYKHILGKSVKHIDMESEDYSFYKGLVFLMDNKVTELGYDLTFSTEVQEFGVTEVRDLIPNGRNIAVTEENKMEYIRLVCQMKMTGAIRTQLNAFLEGFYDIIPKRLISIFNEQELELLLSGLPNIDIEDLKANTEYHKYQTTSLQIQWFWRALRSFDQADRAKFLQFVTGTSKVPLQGFGSLEGMNGTQKFQIHRDDRSTQRLPSAHTCFNQLDLPAYETYDKLRTHILKAINECSEGFGFA